MAGAVVGGTWGVGCGLYRGKQGHTHDMNEVIIAQEG